MLSVWLSQRVVRAGNAVRPVANGDASPEEQHQSMPNGTSSTQPTNQKAPQQPGPPTDEPKPQKAQQAQQNGTKIQKAQQAQQDDAKPFKFDFKPEQQAQQAQQAAPQSNGVHPKPEAADSAASGDSWSEEQQQMLVKALKAIGKDVKDRYRMATVCSNLCLTQSLFADCIITLHATVCMVSRMAIGVTVFG